MNDFGFENAVGSRAPDISSSQKSTRAHIARILIRARLSCSTRSQKGSENRRRLLGRDTTAKNAV